MGFEREIIRERTNAGLTEQAPSGGSLWGYRILFPVPPRVEDPSRFLDLAFEYYLAGRFAVLNYLINVGPTLIHHAVELLIKFTLLKDVPKQDQSAATKKVGKEYKHDLPRLWIEFKRKAAPADLARFDPVIVNLHQWEDLRYGGSPSGNPIMMGVAPLGGEAHASHIKAGDIYNLGLPEVDDLFTTMVVASKINPVHTTISLSHGHNRDLRDWYLRQNQHAIPELFEADEI